MPEPGGRAELRALHWRSRLAPARAWLPSRFAPEIRLGRANPCLSRLLIFACSGEDLLDDSDLASASRGRTSAGALPARAWCARRAPDPPDACPEVAEDQPPLNLWIPDAIHVHLHIRIVVDEEPMPWLPKVQHVACGLEVGGLRGIGLAVGHHRQDVA